MPHPKTLAAYADIKRILDIAVLKATPKSPLTYELKSPSAAIYWRHRANYYRTLCRKREEILHAQPAGTGTSPYDHLKFSVSGNQVLISPHEPEGMLSLDGEILETTMYDQPSLPFDSDLDDLDD